MSDHDDESTPAFKSFIDKQKGGFRQIKAAGIKPLTRIKKRRIKAAAHYIDDTQKDITYQHSVLCQTSLPYRNPGDDTRIWERQQGKVAMSLEAGRARDPKTREFVPVGLPYGSRPRLILAHLNREALLRGSPSIEVEDSLTAFVRRLQGNSPNGDEIRRFKDQLTRFAAATVRLAVDVSPEHAYQIDTKIVSAFDLWHGPKSQRVLWPAEVRLSLDYFESLIKHAVPLDETAMAALSNSPFALDLYAWLAQRLHRIDARRAQRVTWKALYDQFGTGYTRFRDFRAAFLQVLWQVRAQYRAMKVDADDRGLELRYTPPPVPWRHGLPNR